MTRGPARMTVARLGRTPRRAPGPRPRARTAASIRAPESRFVWAFPLAPTRGSTRISFRIAAIASLAAPLIWSACAAIRCVRWVARRAASMPRHCSASSRPKRCARASATGVVRSCTRLRAARPRLATATAALSAAAFPAASRFAAVSAPSTSRRLASVKRVARELERKTQGEPARNLEWLQRDRRGEVGACAVE